MLRVLKGVALQRSGKDAEGLHVRNNLPLLSYMEANHLLPHAVQICDEVRREAPTDEQILSTMTIVYRKANRMQDMSVAFAAASSAHPTDAGLLKGVFTCHARQVLHHPLTNQLLAPFSSCP